jgi:hypothetical protein
MESTFRLMVVAPEVCNLHLHEVVGLAFIHFCSGAGATTCFAARRFFFE